MMIHIKKGIFLIGIGLTVTSVLFLCSVSKEQKRVMPDQNEVSKVTDSSKIKIVESTNDSNVVTEPITPDNWLNESFVLLPKSTMFQRFGYELYKCADTAMCNSYDTFLTLTNKRAKYERFSGDTLIVTAVNRNTGNEWVVTFSDKRYSATLFAFTRKSALSEMVLLRDIEAAKKRWCGKTVFSRKGVISVAGSNGNLSSLKVRMFDSLHVYDVRLGLTPLPVNPIWIMVRTRNGADGFIPVRYSWSNVMSEQISDDIPWGEEIIEFNPVQHFNWDTMIWEIIENHRVTIGMNQDQVFMSWGRPQVKVDTTFNNSKVQCWFYAAQKLYFNAVGLIAIEDMNVR
jgi:hypothetical protein